MLEIATRARISKRDLYAEFENKRALLTHCVSFRAQKMRQPEGLTAAVDDRSLVAALVIFGANLLQELTDPEVLLVYYLAIAECWRAPEVAKILDKCGREVTERVLEDLLEQAQAKGLLARGDTGEMAEEYLALLLRNLLLRLILRVMPLSRSFTTLISVHTLSFLVSLQHVYPPRPTLTVAKGP
jgi:AcrR family transcriptional regulator